jgi:hypothetical protein
MPDVRRMLAVVGLSVAIRALAQQESAAAFSRRAALGALGIGVLALMMSILGWLFPRR